MGNELSSGDSLNQAFHHSSSEILKGGEGSDKQQNNTSFFGLSQFKDELNEEVDNIEEEKVDDLNQCKPLPHLLDILRDDFN